MNARTPITRATRPPLTTWVISASTGSAFSTMPSSSFQDARRSAFTLDTTRPFSPPLDTTRTSITSSTLTMSLADSGAGSASSYFAIGTSFLLPLILTIASLSFTATTNASTKSCSFISLIDSSSAANKASMFISSDTSRKPP